MNDLIDQLAARGIEVLQPERGDGDSVRMRLKRGDKDIRYVTTLSKIINDPQAVIASIEEALNRQPEGDQR